MMTSWAETLVYLNICYKEKRKHQQTQTVKLYQKLNEQETSQYFMEPER
jgi:hypothetical protein